MKKEELSKQIKPSVCVITVIFNECAGGSDTLIFNILSIFQNLNQEIYLIGSDHTKRKAGTSKAIKFFPLKSIKGNFVVLKILHYLWVQVQIACIIFRLRKKVDNGFYFIAGSLVLPTLMTRCLGKDAVLVNPASGFERIIQEYRSRSFIKYSFAYSIKFLSSSTQKYSSKIVLSTENLVNILKLDRYKSKIYYAPGEFIRSDKFFIKNQYELRNNIVGYIGRLSLEKGVLNFVKSISNVISENNDIKFVIIGEGPLKKEIDEYINDLNLNDRVTLMGWVSKEEVVEYLNKLKILILPSYTEGLPNIVLEAMACGTPVLSTPVGSVPDIIIDGNTGFLMDNNSVSCIYENILRVFSSEKLDNVSKNSINFVMNNFSFENAVEKYKHVVMRKESY